MTAAHAPAPAEPTAPARSLPEEGATTATTTGARALAALRIATGAIFLWAFLDKTFGWRYSTHPDNSWINGGSPAEGWLSSVAVGPLESTLNDWAGQTWVDIGFMGGMFGLGVALLAGVGLRLAAVGGTVMMFFLWAGEFPPAQHLSDGSASGSAHPFVDKHVVYAVSMIVVAACSAGRVWGLGRAWERLPLVRRYPWLR